MRTTRRIVDVAMIVLGAVLVGYHFTGGLWPLTVQFVLGCTLVLYGSLRLRYF